MDPARVSRAVGAPLDEARRSIVPSRTVLFVLLLFASALLRLLYAPRVPLTGDELMHWAWSRHLAAGYPEHPPLIAWLIAATTGLFGPSEMSVRVVPITATTVTIAAAFVLGRELFGERAAFFGAAPLLVTPIFNAGGVLANTDGLLACFWTLTALALKRAVIDGRRLAWPVAGATAGLALLSKLPGVFLFPATALFLASSPAGRRWARRAEPYAAATVALLVFSPVVWWNLRHGWLTISMRVGHDSAGGLSLGSLGELLAAQLLTVSPLLLLWMAWGLARCVAGWRDIRLALLGSYSLVPVGFYLAYSLSARAGIHWPAIGYMTAFVAAGAATTMTDRPRFAARWLAAASVVGLAITALLYLIPLFPQWIEGSYSYAPRPEKVNSSALDNIFDWGELGVEVRRELDRVGSDAFVLCRDGYGLAGLVGFYTPGQPPVFLWNQQVRNGAAYDLWKAAARLRGRDAVVVEDGFNREWFDRLRGAFDTLSAPRLVEIRRGDRVLRRFYVLRGTGFRGFPETEDSASGSAEGS